MGLFKELQLWFRIPFPILLGYLDFLFLVGTVFSLLALLFTFDAVAGEREAGTLRITLANSLPRDLFLWSKLIGGYIVFVVPFFGVFSIRLIGTCLARISLSVNPKFFHVCSV